MAVNWPNTLTWIRILAIPLIVVVFFLPVTWAGPAAGILFALAGITDYLDGYLARKMSQTSRFGAFLDPVADKLVVATALVLIVQRDPQIYLSVVAAIIIGREITVSALREWMSEIGASAKVSVTWFGKWKTTVQIIGISLMLFKQAIGPVPVYLIGEVLLLVAAALTIFSMLDYLRSAWPALRDSG
ncbi:MAG TPA: CDP-diacylglycerol--glycerol-3-phosphate 3-phosphatidyltransferase [Gammaproteobacteria bacterium]|jgi:CDP-diacylglycerol--glycerol-3-phosphate 3-phosphatidyltransferase